jgi:LysM repeat protein
MSPTRRSRLRHPLVTGLLLAAIATASAGGYGWVRVHPGDTLTAIAAKHHTTVSELVALNHLPGNGNLIYAGERLRVPLRHHPHSGRHAAHHKGRPHHHRAHHHRAHHHRAHHHRGHHHRAHRHRSARHAARRHWVVSHYTVQSGDSLYAICARFHVPEDRVARANNLPSSLVVRIGQELRIGHWSHAHRHHVHRHRGHHRRHAHHHHGLHHRARHHHAHRHHRRRHHRRHSGVPAWVRHEQAVLAHMAVPSRDAVGRMIANTARRFGIDARFAMAIGWQESGFNQREVSPVGAIGAMQVMPATGVFVSTYIVHRHLNLLRARDNVTAGVGLLSALLANTHHNQRLAAAGYYQGLDSVRAHGMFRDTKQYVADVLALRQRF